VETDERVHSSVPGDEEGCDDENACEEWQPEGGLVDHVANNRVANGSVSHLCYGSVLMKLSPASFDTFYGPTWMFDYEQEQERKPRPV